MTIVIALLLFLVSVYKNGLAILSENKINKIIEFKRKVLPIKDSSIIKKKH